MHAGTALLLLLAAPAQEREIQVSGHAGWGGVAARGDWAPVLVDVDNRGAKDRDLVLILTWAFPGSNQQSATPSVGGLYGRSGPTHHVPVSVAARSRKRVPVTMLAPDQDRMSAWVYAVAPTGGGKPFALAELPTRPVEAGQRFLAVVGTDLPDGFPSAANVVARVTPEALPEDWRGYAGLDALLWLDGRPAEIRSQAQVDALRTWVSAGGRLVIARSTDVGIPGSALADLLPVTIKGTVPLDGLELFGRKAAGRVAVLENVLQRGKVLARHGPIPLVVDSPLDGGHVTFLAFDPTAPPFAGWDGAAPTWDALLGRPSPARSDRQSDARAARILGSDHLAQLARRFPDVEPPAIGWLFVLIIAYLVVVGPLDYFVLRAFRRLELTWITFPSYVVGFTLFILLAGGAFMSRAAYQREIAVIDHHLESGFARHRSLSAVLAPTDLVYSIRDAEPLCSNFTIQTFAMNMAEKLHETRIVHGKERMARDWVLNRSFTGLAMSDRCSRSPSPLTWKAEGPPGARFRVTVQNETSTTFTLARLVAPSGVYDLGEIAPGSTTIEASRLFTSMAQFVTAEGGERRDADNPNYYYRGEGRISEPELNVQVRQHLVQLGFGAQEATGFARSVEARGFVEAGGSVLVAFSRSDDPQVRFEPFPSRRNGFQMVRFFVGPQP